MYYDTYDISSFLSAGSSEHVLAITLGHGWYAQPSVNVGPPSLYMLLSVHVTNSDGSSSVIQVPSDTTWSQAAGPITMDDIYNGKFMRNLSIEIQCDVSFLAI